MRGCATGLDRPFYHLTGDAEFYFRPFAILGGESQPGKVCEGWEARVHPTFRDKALLISNTACEGDAHFHYGGEGSAQHSGTNASLPYGTQEGRG